ncbi:anaerobic glycerol-3-phosphate dehydrogenase subunit C [candidate division TA06 bacterium]|uniref:D-lactate dehydrogenase (cytochrome) n=1 Tax=candidate division TA06 bacterium TaxID=2250710 RepID=A0A523UTP6_UNCT6|nr:MAG: anaerobic glycerol-3-phosphate dehydrogenase subunit C [candidate division TA06 bacterium]
MVNSQTICKGLRPLVRGEVFCDNLHRTLYSSAACIYEIEPAAVVYPKDKHDVAAVMGYCYRHGIPVTPRGAGSGLAGQSVGEGIIIDLSRHMNHVLKVNEDDWMVRVQPGVVLSNLNKTLKPRGRFFPPDPSSSDYCTIGGMIANNSSGSHSLKYGATKDYVASLEVVLCNGEIVEITSLAWDSPELGVIKSKETQEGAIYTSMLGLLWRNKELIEEYSPKVEKNSSGYNLKEAFVNGILDLTKVVVGSEGTLGVVTEATLRIVDLPEDSCVLLLFFDDLRKIGEAVTEARQFQPASIELMDRTFLGAAKELVPDLEDLIPQDTEAILLVEFEGEDASIEAKGIDLRGRVVDEIGLGTGGVLAHDKGQMEKLWRLRKAAVPMVMKSTGRRRPIPFIEDVVVPPQRLPDFLNGLHAILENYAVDSAAYGHAGEGNIHVRPLLDLSRQKDIEKMEAVAGEVYSLVRGLEGSPSGEHGDGLVRAPFLKDFSGPLYELFFWTKRIFDPKGILNPGKKICDKDSISEDLRFGASYENVATGTGFDDKNLIEQIERCHGCGMCRSAVDTTMCPVYKALGDEKYTPRAKANLLRALVRGRLKPDELIGDPQFRELIGMCYQCRMCLSECPTEVNMPLLTRLAKAEIVKRHGMPLSDRMFCNFESVGRLASRSALVSNFLMRIVPMRAVVEWLSGLSRARDMPPFNKGQFKLKKKSSLLRGRTVVVYFPGCFVNFMDARLGQSLSNLLERADMELVVPDLSCCGIPSLSLGDLDGARKRAEGNIRVLLPFASKGIPIVATCPSCALALKKEYIELLGTEEAQVVAGMVRDATAFVLDLVAHGELRAKALKALPRTVYHAPCHLKALGLEEDSIGQIAERLSLRLGQIEDSCCGTGGTFGFKRRHFDISQQIGLPLFESIKSSDASVVITECPTCKIQISQGTGLDVIHPIELLEVACADGQPANQNGMSAIDAQESI